MKSQFALAAVVAAVLVGAVAACGGDSQVSRDQFNARLQSIDERGGELWGYVANEAEDLGLDEPLPENVTRALTELVDFQEQSAAELESLTPPEAAEGPVQMLIEALRERTETLRQAIEAGHFTEEDSERITQAGEKIDQAFAQLRSQGFLATTDAHEEG
jgi:hypothetical protein